MNIKEFIIQLLQKKEEEGIHGRVQLQKIVYFCKALGADVNANYKLYIYGPYSQQVANALQDCVLDDILTEEDGYIRIGQNFENSLNDLLEHGQGFPERTSQIVDEVLSLCQNLSTKQLEITATTFFINRQQKALFGIDDKKSVLDKVTQAKKCRFTQEEIEESYQRLLDSFLPLETAYATSNG